MGYLESKIAMSMEETSTIDHKLLWDIHTLQKHNYETIDFVKSLSREMRIRLLSMEFLELLMIERNENNTQNFIIHKETIRLLINYRKREND